MNKLLKAVIGGSLVSPLFPGGGGGGFIIDPNIKDSDISYFCLSPLSLHENVSYGYLQVNLSIKINSSISVNVYIVNDIYIEGKIIYSITCTSDEDTIQYFEYDNAYTRITNIIKIEKIVNGSSTFYESEIGVESEDLIYLNESNFEHITNNNVLSFMNGKFEYTSVMYDFEGFEPTYYPNQYHNIKLDQLTITLSNNYFPKLFSSGYLYLTNNNEVFNDMPLNGSNLRVPITFEKSLNNTYHLCLRDVYYINPDTYLMSSTKKDGFLETKYIYFPNSEMNELQNYKARILLLDFGVEHSRVIYEFSFKSLFSLLGNCIDSEYCIRVEDVFPSDNGWVI